MKPGLYKYVIPTKIDRYRGYWGLGENYEFIGFDGEWFRVEVGNEFPKRTMGFRPSFFEQSLLICFKRVNYKKSPLPGWF